MVDPHTADGLMVAALHRRADEVMLVLETALPVKFAATMQEALGCNPDLPAGLEGLEAMPRKFVRLAADTRAVMHYVESHA